MSLDQFAAVSNGMAAFNYDQSKLVEIADDGALPRLTSSAWRITGG
jgi:hypothetical protein